MSVRTVKVSNISPKATEQEIKEFFSFSGHIEYFETQRDAEQYQIAYITFKDSDGAENAVLLSGATIVGSTVVVALDPDYQLPPAAFAVPVTKEKAPGRSNSALRKAEDIVTSMLAKGYILGKDAVAKAKNFDEKHRLTSTASAKVASFDKKIGLSAKISAGTAVVGDKVKEVDRKHQVSTKTKSALATAEAKVSNAGSTIMKNQYVSTGASWVTDQFGKVAKAAEEFGQKTKEKVVMADEEKKRKVVDEYAKIHLSEPPESSESSEDQSHKHEASRSAEL